MAIQPCNRPDSCSAVEVSQGGGDGLLCGVMEKQIPVEQPRRVMTFAASSQCEITFGDFRLLPSKRLLMEGGAPVPIGSRALDLLIIFVERAGNLLSKEELIRQVWPETHVVEGNLTVHIAALRRVLGDGRTGRRYIVNTPGRGYRFVEPVKVGPFTGALAGEVPRHNLPARLTRLIGRDRLVRDLARQLANERLATLTGPAGIGKSSVANAVAKILLPACCDGVRRVDLVTLTDPDHVPAAVAAALDAEVTSTNPLGSLVGALRDKQLLLVLDNCDQFLKGAASLALALLKASRAVHVLATSREPLRTQGEHVHSLAPLACPPADPSITQVRALRFPAFELFVETAATFGNYSFSDADAPFIAQICRKLDGIPLAIELAAGHLDVFSVRSLADQVCTDPSLLSGRQRSADARHESMEAALDWSYALLTAEQAEVFRRLATLAGPFTLDEATAVARQPGSRRTADQLAELAAKSFLIVEIDGAAPRFRMLEMMRKYALRKLAETALVEPGTAGTGPSPPKLRVV